MTATTLSTDQAKARDTIHAALRRGQREIVLAGPAGSGKTTLMRTLLADLRADGKNVVLMAPTGKAAARLRDLTGGSTSTIHQLLYSRVWENDEGKPVFSDPSAVAAAGSVLIVDEASMVGRSLHFDLIEHLPKGVQVLWVGDREQLPPVLDTWGPNFDQPTALLDQVHRQAAESPIIRLATAIRQGDDWRAVPNAPGYHRAKSTIGKVGAWAARRRDAGNDVVLLTFTNKVRHELNASVRRQRGHACELHTDDRLVSLFNSYSLGIMNGEQRTVRSLEAGPAGFTHVELVEGGHALVRPDLFGCETDEWKAAVDALKAANPVLDYSEMPAWRLAMRADLGECLTVHKSQGSQWRLVCFVADPMLRMIGRRDSETYRRVLYTAVTRASDSLFIAET